MTTFSVILFSVPMTASPGRSLEHDHQVKIRDKSSAAAAAPARKS